MTQEEFIEDWGKDYRKFSKTPLFAAMMNVAESQSPITESENRTPGDIVVAGHILFTEAKANYRLLKLFKKDLLEKEKDAEPKDDYKEQPEI